MHLSATLCSLRHLSSVMMLWTMRLHSFRLLALVMSLCLAEERFSATTLFSDGVHDLLHGFDDGHAPAISRPFVGHVPQEQASVWYKKFLFTFGDSYTTDGFNISAGVNSPVPGFTSSNGPNWVEFLGGTYNVTDTKVFNLASGGATIDAALVAPYLPTVLSIVDQVSQFETYLADKPEGAQWRSNNSLFAFWIGINDVGNSYAWTNVTSQSEFHHVLMSRLFSQVEKLYDSGARSFLFLTVPPTNRAPLLLEQGATAVRAISAALDDYNAQLAANVQAFKGKHRDLDQVTVFDTRPVFNLLLDNANTLGFVNATGFCDAYQNGTPDMTTQIVPCAPVSSYFWLNTLHPLFTVHNILAHAIATKLSG